MFKTLTAGLALASTALMVAGASPATAQSSYGHGGDYENRGDQYDDAARRYDARDYRDAPEYDNRDYSYRQREVRARYEARRRAEYARSLRSSGYYNRGGGYEYANRDYAQQLSYNEGRPCRSGTTGAILGAVLGGLLGREIGRGGDYNEPSTTGLILGAGGGALAGRAIERSGSNCR